MTNQIFKSLEMQYYETAGLELPDMEAVELTLDAAMEIAAEQAEIELQEKLDDEYTTYPIWGFTTAQKIENAKQYETWLREVVAIELEEARETLRVLLIEVMEAEDEEEVEAVLNILNNRRLTNEKNQRDLPRLPLGVATGVLQKAVDRWMGEHSALRMKEGLFTGKVVIKVVETQPNEAEWSQYFVPPHLDSPYYQLEVAAECVAFGEETVVHQQGGKLVPYVKMDVPKAVKEGRRVYRTR